MRADRLLSIMLLLQTRERMTAQELAHELEVSERTIYRDMIALSTAGVPVYGTSGPEGGFSLVESYRTSLTGLTEGEVRALFMLSIPTPLRDLGLTQELKAAMRKLAAALPSSSRGAEERVRQRIFLDSAWWHQEEENVPHLQTLYQALWQDRQIGLKYRPHPQAEVELVVDPYGLVAKAGAWYLVSHRNLQIHVHRVAGLSEVNVLETNFNRPEDFDLQAFWEGWRLDRENRHTEFAVTVRVAKDFIPWLPMYFGSRIREHLAQAGPPDDRGRITFNLFFESLEAARERLLSCGGGLEVLAPWALRASIQDYAVQIIDQYRNSDA
jgi:predicted DNA-binding transcriptional regulator YafY